MTGSFFSSFNQVGKTTDVEIFELPESKYLILGLNSGKSW